MKIKFSTRRLKKDQPQDHDTPHVQEPEKSALSYLVYFFIIVGLCIFIALTVRLIFLYKKSTFTTPSYSVLFDTKRPFIVALDRNISHASIVTLSSVPKGTRVGQSLSLGVPIDGTIKTSSDISSSSFPSLSNLFLFMVKSWSFRYEGMTSLDAFKIILFSLPIAKQDIAHYSASYSKGSLTGIKQNLLYDAFKDQGIIHEQLSMEIVNATSIDGLGGLVGGVLKNVGGNVISINSGDDKNLSAVIAMNRSKTLDRISHLLGIPISIVEHAVGTADIKIVLGDDFSKLRGASQ